MKTMKLQVLVPVIATICLGNVTQAQLTTSFTSVNTLIPDGQPTGLVSSTNWSGVSGVISSLSLSLDISGGYNGDLYAYLSGPGGGFAVLLNRVGEASGDAFGYSDSGLNVTFTDGDSNVHYYQLDSPTYSAGQLTGTWGPDGRNVNPQSSASVIGSTSPTADFSSFDNTTADGTWTLFVADLSSGGQATLESWGLSVVTVPEPQSWLLATSGVGLLLMLARSRKR